MTIRVLDGDMRDVVPTLDRIDAVVTDPPYELNFMGRAWDRSGVAFQPATWWPVFTALKPGGHLVAFGSTRTYHRLVCAIEDAGFEIRDTLCWHFATGFPKSVAIDKVIDRTLGAEREVVGTKLGRPGMAKDGSNQRSGFDAAFGGAACGVLPTDITAPATPEAAQWQGWGSALKPAMELICLARKPLEGTLAQNTLKHGVGGLNIDACRVETDAAEREVMDNRSGAGRSTEGWGHIGNRAEGVRFKSHITGRWPANVILSDDDEVLATFEAYGERPSKGGGGAPSSGFWGTAGGCDGLIRNDTGSAARFFFSSKADKADRADSKHPTVKPVDLMRWLVRLVCPPGGTVLDCFAGSGSTGEAAMLEGMNAILIERDPASAKDIRHRIRRWSGEDCPLFAEVAD